MTTPMKPVPELVARWMARVRWFRWLDALVAWAGLWGLGAAVLGRGLAGEAAGLALILEGLGFVVRPLRTRWRPLSGWMGLAMSRGLHPGDRAWYVRPHQADLVLVTARHGARLVIAAPNLAKDESLTVRRTRVLVLPADSA
jgi:hypothetical protein